MQIKIVDLTNEDVMRRACEMTMKGQKSRISRKSLLKCEHSPVRLINFWIEMFDIPTFVSTHIVRHKHGVEHFVESNRTDRGGSNECTRLTPVKHGMFVNAQALINMSRKRLCHQASPETIQVWRKLRKEMLDVCPDTAYAMVPECVYRGGICHELRPCAAGPEKIMKQYRKEALV